MNWNSKSDPWWPCSKALFSVGHTSINPEGAIAAIATTVDQSQFLITLVQNLDYSDIDFDTYTVL